MTVKLAYRYCVQCGVWRNFEVVSEGQSTLTLICDGCKHGRVVLKSEQAVVEIAMRGIK